MTNDDDDDDEISKRRESQGNDFIVWLAIG